MNSLVDRLLILLLGLAACAQADGRDAPLATRRLAQPAPPIVRAMAVPGDTLGYAVTWSAVSAASTYDFAVSVTATNGAWTATFGSTPVGALPAPGNTATTGPVVVKLSAIPWDSATFMFSYRARHVPARSSADTSVFVGSTWKVTRKLGTPLPPTVTPDSNTLKVTGLRLWPQNPRFFADTSQRGDFCAFVRFASGQIVKPTDVPIVPCDAYYLAATTVAQRTGITPQQQALADSTCVIFVFPPQLTVLYQPVCPLALRPALRWQVAVR